MKKSEMLKLIERDLIDSASSVEFQARMVLARCISVGMLPPEVSNPKLEYHPNSGKQLLVLKMNKWEPEDELREVIFQG